MGKVTAGKCKNDMLLTGQITPQILITLRNVPKSEILSSTTALFLILIYRK